MDRMIELQSEQQADEVLGQDLAVIFKYSARCHLCAQAHGEVAQYIALREYSPVYLVDVIGHKQVSEHIERRTGIPHESPQVIVVRHGTPVWHASHEEVTASALAEHTPAGATAG